MIRGTPSVSDANTKVATPPTLRKPAASLSTVCAESSYSRITPALPALIVASVIEIVTARNSGVTSGMEQLNGRPLESDRNHRIAFANRACPAGSRHQ